jgi:FixJ family two-component response regulator
VSLVASLRAVAPDLAVLFISGYSDAELPEIESAAASDEFLQKPFTGVQLLARIQDRLAARRLSLPSVAHTR